MSFSHSGSTIEIDYTGDSNLDNYFIDVDNYDTIKNCEYLFIDEFIFEDNIIKIKLSENGDTIEFLKPYQELQSKFIESFENKSSYICHGNDGHEKEYEFYCKICMKNLCRECYINDKHHNNQKVIVNFNQIIKYYLDKSDTIKTKLENLLYYDESHLFYTVHEILKNNNKEENKKKKIYNNYSFFSTINGFEGLLKGKN